SGTKQRGIGYYLRANLKRHIVGIGAKVHDGANPVVSRPAKMVNEVFPGVCVFCNLARFDNGPPEMVVSIDNRRHDRLAREIDAGRARWGLKLSFPSDSDETVILHQECRVFDGRAAVPNDEPRTLEQGCSRRLGSGV